MSVRSLTLRAALGIYKGVVSPVLHSVGVSRCIFLPTCSEYAYVAMLRYGFVRGFSAGGGADRALSSAVEGRARSGALSLSPSSSRAPVIMRGGLFFGRKLLSTERQESWQSLPTRTSKAHHRITALFSSSWR